MSQKESNVTQQIKVDELDNDERSNKEYNTNSNTDY